MIANATQAQMS